MAIEKTFIMIKPDAVRDRKIGEIVARIERSGLVMGQPHAAPALVLKCRQAKARRVGGDGGGVKLFDCVAVGQTGCAEARGIIHTACRPSDSIC